MTMTSMGTSARAQRGTSMGPPRFLAALGMTVTLASLAAAAPARAQSVQYRSPAGVEYRSQADTGPVARAERALAADPRSAQRYVDLAVAQSGARQFREAIATLTRGLQVAPDDPTLLRWRGHRYLSVRELDRATADLTRGLARDSTMYGILYHLGIVRFARGDFNGAAEAFARAQPRAPDAGELAGSTDWLWMSLMRAGRAAEARAMLARRPDSLPVTNAYARRLKLYRGEIGPDAVFTPADTADVQVATLAYGVGNWHLVRGDTARAREWFARSVRSGGWPGFGFIVSEVELQRLSAAGADPRDDAEAMIARVTGPQSPDRQGFDALTLPQLMQRLRVPGVSVAVIRDGRIHWARAWGVADAETGQPADTGTLFQAASISKPVFAMAVVRLAQEGRLSLDGDVNAILASWRVPRSEATGERPVTLRALLSHTSGADDGFGFPGYAPDAPRPTLVQVLNGERPSNVGPVRFARPPYAGMKYSGGGLVLAQLAVADLVKRPFADMMRDLVLAPAGMGNSTYAQPLPDALAPRAARAHGGDGRRMGAPWHVYPEQSAAGLWTTPSDLARFAIEVQRAVAGPRGAVLGQAAAREMIAPTGTGGYAVGLGIAQRGEGWYFSHSGGNWGFACDMLAHVRKGYGVVVMTNGDGGGRLVAELEARVAAAYGWDSLDKPIPR